MGRSRRGAFLLLHGVQLAVERAHVALVQKGEAVAQPRVDGHAAAAAAAALGHPSKHGERDLLRAVQHRHIAHEGVAHRRHPLDLQPLHLGLLRLLVGGGGRELVGLRAAPGLQVAEKADERAEGREHHQLEREGLEQALLEREQRLGLQLWRVAAHARAGRRVSVRMCGFCERVCAGRKGRREGGVHIELARAVEISSKSQRGRGSRKESCAIEAFAFAGLPAEQVVQRDLLFLHLARQKERGKDHVPRVLLHDGHFEEEALEARLSTRRQVCHNWWQVGKGRAEGKLSAALKLKGAVANVIGDAIAACICGQDTRRVSPGAGRPHHGALCVLWHRDCRMLLVGAHGFLTDLLQLALVILAQKLLLVGCQDCRSKMQRSR
eukprot:2316341-Pleurochrysis_carterae.AAC.3